MTPKRVGSFRHKVVCCRMKPIRGEVEKSFRYITKLKTAPKLAGVHLIFDD